MKKKMIIEFKKKKMLNVENKYDNKFKENLW
jgi:hypothetical protein